MTKCLGSSLCISQKLSFRRAYPWLHTPCQSSWRNLHPSHHRRFVFLKEPKSWPLSAHVRTLKSCKCALSLHAARKIWNHHSLRFMQCDEFWSSILSTILVSQHATIKALRKRLQARTRHTSGWPRMILAARHTVGLPGLKQLAMFSQTRSWTCQKSECNHRRHGRHSRKEQLPSEGLQCQTSSHR